jgi:hypothetical protein
MKTFKVDCVDRGFRDAVKSVVSRASKEIIVITGEFSVLDHYHDLQLLLDETFQDRSIKMKVYMSEENYGTINKLFFLNPGRTEVFVGTQKVEDHYVLCDRKFFVHTSRHPRKSCGVRAGEYEDKDPSKGQSYIKQKDILGTFSRLTHQKGIKKITAPDMSRDPLYAKMG